MYIVLTQSQQKNIHSPNLTLQLLPSQYFHVYLYTAFLLLVG